MTIHIAAYKGTGHFTDKVVRAALSFSYGKNVSYSHVELMKGPRTYPYGGSEISSQMCLAASKRDGGIVRKKQIFFQPGYWDFLSFPGDIWEEAQATLGSKYDTIGAALCITKFARLHLEKEWCSGLIADLAEWENPETFDPYLVVLKGQALGGRLEIG